MNFEKQIRALCTPAKIYFLLSMVTILGMLIQNSLGSSTLHMGNKTVHLPHKNILFFVFKTMSVILWTYILQNLCKSGYKNISWFLVLLPYFFFFLITGLIIFHFSSM